MSSFNILVSCMHEKSNDIIKKANIESNAVIINQCDEDSRSIINLKDSTISWINSTERGLSRSRNMAIKNSNADICLLADNDEVFDDDIEDKILMAYDELPDADIIIFRLHNKTTKLKNKIYKPWRMEMQRICSLQISFKRSSIVNNKLKFDVKLGAGTGNGAGEENKFLVDCYDAGLKIYHYPLYIANIVESESTWFNGYNEKFFYNHGMVTRYTWGLMISVLYAFYYSVVKYKMYKNDISFYKVFKAISYGIFDNKLSKRL